MVCTTRGTMSEPFALGEALAKQERPAVMPIKDQKPNPLSRAILDSMDFMALPLPAKRDLLTPWLKEQSICLLTGWRGTGKTWFGLSICNAITSGESFGPWEAETPCPCLYLEAEMAACDIQDRIRQLAPAVERKAPLYVYCDAYANSLGMKRANLLSRKWRNDMRELLLERGVKLWVADNIASLSPGIDENVKAPWDPVNQWLLELRFLGISTILIHHVGKEGQQRGTSAREDNIDLSLTLSHPSDYVPEDGARFIAKFTKARIPTKDLSAIGDTEFKLTTGLNDCLTWTWRNVRKQNKIEVLKLLDQGMSQHEIAQAMGVTRGRVSQIKACAIRECLLSKKGSLTQSGFVFVSA